MTGDVIGPYRLLAPIGKGAMGEVWRARDERLDRLVAVKLLPPDLAGDPERRARMLREARAAAAVAHGNVVTLYDIVQADGRDVLVMELVDGHTVAEILRREGAPALEKGLGWLIALTDALRAAHGRGILHRDIKAANVMVTVQGQVKVLDFGLAKLGEDAGTVSVSDTVSDPVSVSVSDPVSVSVSVSDPVSVADTVVAPASGSGSGGKASSEYATRAGTLLGTPMYMAPEQIAGASPDERTEVFSVGVLAHEIIAGKPPFKARTVEDLFVEISRGEAPRLADPVPDVVADVVAKALAHDREARFPTMDAFHAALVAVREQLFGRRVSRWPWLAAAAMVVGVLIAGTLWWLQQPPPTRVGDIYVQRALDEYDVFYNDKALSSLRAALRVDPTHPRALAYLVLFGGTDAERADAVRRARPLVPAARGKDRQLLSAVIALEEGGAVAARAALVGGGDADDRELRFWAAELAYLGGAYDVALPAYRELYEAGGKRFRGRVYDHYSAVLLWADEPAAAAEVGQRYHDAYPGEADAVGVHATTLAAAGDMDRALALAEEAAALSRGEDTLAGLAKVRALRNELEPALALYSESLSLAPPPRRPMRRAALALLLWMKGDAATAEATVTPCLPGGADAALPTRAACLFVAAVVLPAGDPRIDVARQQLEALAAAATPTRPAYGAPAALAALVRARQQFTAGGCIGPRPPPPADLPNAAAIERDLAAPVDFYAGYHVPFFATWAICERAWLAKATGDDDRARALLHPVAVRGSGRWWLTDDDAALSPAP